MDSHACRLSSPDRTSAVSPDSIENHQSPFQTIPSSFCPHIGIRKVDYVKNEDL